MGRMYHLRPTRGQKSFYNKAFVTEHNNGVKTLASYGTNVCAIDTDGKLRRLWGGWSATTARHVNSFLETYGLEPISKSQWYEIPLED